MSNRAIKKQNDKSSSQNPSIARQSHTEATDKERHTVTIDYRIRQPALPSSPDAYYPDDWANTREGLMLQAEAERKRRAAEVYKYLTPPK